MLKAVTFTKVFMAELFKIANYYQINIKNSKKA